MWGRNWWGDKGWAKGSQGEKKIKSQMIFWKALYEPIISHHRWKIKCSHRDTKRLHCVQIKEHNNHSVLYAVQIKSNILYMFLYKILKVKQIFRPPPPPQRELYFLVIRQLVKNQASVASSFFSATYLAMWPWANYLIPLCPSFFICTMRIIIAPVSQDY